MKDHLKFHVARYFGLRDSPTELANFLIYIFGQTENIDFRLGTGAELKIFCLNSRMPHTRNSIQCVEKVIFPIYFKCKIGN